MAMILDDLRAATPIAEKSLDAYLASNLDEIVTERYYHLIIGAGHAPPRDYYDSFTQLTRLRILPPAFASQIATCAGLRNRLVHEYDEIDPRRVYEGLVASVRDIPEYLRHVHDYVQGLPPTQTT